jgi:Domain of unknown function (DUF3817)
VTTPLEQPAVGEFLNALSPVAQLKRKVRVTKLIAVTETVTYLILLPLMFRRYALNVHEQTWQFLLRRITAYFHGFVSIAYGVMILDIYRAMRWSKRFALLSLAGPPGAIIAYRRLATQPLPESVTADQMLF